MVLPSPCNTAPTGTTGSVLMESVWRIVPYISGRNRPAALSISARTLMVRVCGSTVSAMRVTRPWNVWPGYAVNSTSMRSPTAMKRMALSGTSEDTHTVLRSAMVITGVLVSFLYSPAATLISSTLPEIGAFNVIFWPNAPGLSPSSRSFRSDCSSAAWACSNAALDCASAFSAVSTSFFATALCSNRSAARS